MDTWLPLDEQSATAVCAQKRVILQLDLEARGDSIMLGADDTKPPGADENGAAGKSGQRNRKKQQSGKSGQRSRKSAHRQTTTPELPPDEVQAAEGQVTAPSNEDHSIEGTPASVEQVPAAETAPVSLQSLAGAYEECATRSLKQTREFFENLAGVRSFDKALELQTDFMKDSCEAFIADARKIRQLHSDLARQGLGCWEGLAAKVTPIAFLPPASRK